MRSFVASLCSRVSWRNVVATQAIALFVIGVGIFESPGSPTFGTWLGHPELEYVATSLCAAAVLLLGLAADVFVERGARAERAFPLAMALTLPITCCVSWGAQSLCAIAVHRWPTTLEQHFAFVDSALGLAFLGAFCLLVYMNRRIADRMLEGVRQAELKRLRQERELVNSRLATAEAQIDPRDLMDSLAAIRRGFETAPGEADVKLDALVRRLRYALQRTNVADDAGEPL